MNIYGFFEAVVIKYGAMTLLGVGYLLFIWSCDWLTEKCEALRDWMKDVW